MKHERGKLISTCADKITNYTKSVKAVLIALFMLLFSATVALGAVLLGPKEKQAPVNIASLGSGTADDPYTISTVAELQALATSVNAGTSYLGEYVVLTNDLDLSGLTWTTIGISSAKSFKGTFDGQNHTISNLYVNQTTAYKGLFGYTVGATIKNVTLINPQIPATKGSDTGALVGYLDTVANGVPVLVSNCHVLGGSVKSTQYWTGGLIGYTYARGGANLVTIEDCSVKGLGNNLEPTVVQGGYYTGGLIGGVRGTAAFKINDDGSYTSGASISRCASTATVISNTSCAGGIIGLGGAMFIDQCYSTGSITVLAGGTAGGIVGFVGVVTLVGATTETNFYNARISNCFATGEISATSNVGGVQAGGIVSHMYTTGSSYPCYVENCIFTGNVESRSAYSTGNAGAGGICSITSRSNYVYFGGNVVASRIVGASCPGTYCAASPIATGWTWTSGSKRYYSYPQTIDGTTNYYNEEMYISARKALYTASTASIVREAVSLEKLKTRSTYEVDLKWDMGNVWTMSAGVNEGYPYLVTLGVPEKPYGSKENPILIQSTDDFKEMSANVNAATNLYSGLYLTQTTDLDLAGVGVTGTAWAKSFRGNYDGLYNGVEHRMLNVSITASVANCAIFGYVANASIQNVIVENAKIYNTGAVNDVGILVGFAASNLYLNNCAVIGGTITAVKCPYVGALCGYANYDGNIITNCFSTATVNGGAKVGGLVGYGVGLILSNSYSKGTITGQVSANHGAGGLVGDIAKPIGTYAYSRDLITTTATNTGAVAPQSTITNCYSLANVSDLHAGASWAFCGGILGRAVSNVTVSNCYYFGTLEASRTGTASTSTGGAFCGGIIGSSYVTNVNYVKNCLSMPEISSMTSTGKYLQASYFNSHYGAAQQPAEYCYYVESDYIKNTLPTTMKPTTTSTAVNDGTPTTLEAVKAIDPSLNYSLVFSALGWDMTNTWSQEEGVNNGLPMLRGLIVDTTELLEILNKAKEYNASDWSTATYGNLKTAITLADLHLSGRIDESTKAKDILNLQRAIDALRADKTELQTYMNTTYRNDVLPNADYYTNFSVVASLAAGAGDIINDNSNKFRNTDVTVVLNALKNAVANLRVDKTKLNTLIQEASALKASDYPAEAFAELQQVIASAVTVNNNAAATVQEVIGATTALEKALSALRLDKTQIVNAIIEAYRYIGVTATYNSDTNKINITDESLRIDADKFESYTAFGEALDDAIAAQEDDKATSEQLQTAIFTLSIELYSLTLDKAPLQELYYSAVALNADYYSAESYAKLKEAITKAESALAYYPYPEIFVECSTAFDEAYDALEAAMKALSLNKKELEELIAKADKETMNELYTTDTWNALQAALTKAKEVDASDTVSQDDIHNAVVALNDAIQNLELNRDYLKDLIAQATKVLADVTYQTYYPAKLLENVATAKTAAEPFVESQNIAEVKAAASDLQKALDALTVDITLLTDRLDRVTNPNNAEYLDPDDYDSDGMEALKKLVEAAQDMLDNHTETDADVISYILRFDALVRDLKPNKDELTKLVSEISGWSNMKYRQDNGGNWIIDEETGNLKVFVIYSEDSWADLQVALKAANDVLLSTKNVTVDDVKTATENLKAARDALVVDTSELELRMVKAKEILDRQAASDTDIYLADTISVLQSAYDAANLLLVDPSKLNLDQVQSCLDTLVAAINGLKVDRQSLLDLIKQAEDLAEYSKYFTDSSYNAMTTQLSYVKDNANNEELELDESDITLLFDLLSDALDGLVIVTDDLQALIDRFDDLEKDFIVADKYSLIEQCAETARKMLQGKFSVTEYKKNLEDLTSAFDLLEPDWAAFKAFIDSSKTNYNDPESYTEDSLNVLLEQLDTATSLYTNKGYTDEDGNSVAGTYDDVVAAVDAIKDAINRLKPLTDDLEALIENTKEEMAETDETFGTPIIVSEYYTDESYQTLWTALENGSHVLAEEYPSLEEVKNAIKDINAALEALVVDTSLLEVVIDECDVYLEEYFDQDSYDNFAAALEQSKADVENPELTLEEYKTSYTNLKEAMDALQFSLDALDKLITLAEQEKGDDYSPTSFGNLTEALKAAKAFRDDDTRKPEDSADDYKVYNETCANLLAAISELIYTADLTAEIQNVETFLNGVDSTGYDTVNEKYYSLGSVNAVKDLGAHAKVLDDQPDPTQAVVDDMVAQLKDYESLLLDITEAKKASDDAHDYADDHKDDFTEDTWSDYQDALDELDDLLKKDDVTQEELDDALKALEDAKKSLNAASLEALIAQAKEKDSADYSADSFANFKKELDAAIEYTQGENPDPDAYDDVFNKLSQAIDDLVYIADLADEIKNVQTFLNKVDETGKESGTDPDTEAAYEKYYSLGSVKEVKDLLADATNLYEKSDPTQDDVDDMVKQLKDYESLLLDITEAKNFSDDEHEYVDDHEGDFTDETWTAYTEALEDLDDLLDSTAAVTKDDLDAAIKAVQDAKDALVSLDKGLFEVIETNNSFKFIHGDGTVLDNFSEHEYDPEAPVYLTDIAKGDSLADIIAQFKNKDITAYDAEGAEITDLTHVVATGIVLKIIEDGEVVDTLTLVLHGDLNGDGNVNSTDKSQLNAYTSGTRVLEGAYWLAADVNGDGKVNSTDKSQLNAYTLGTRDLFENLSVQQVSNEGESVA